MKILTILASYGVHPSPQGTEFLTRDASANNRLDIQRRYATLKLLAIALHLPSNCHKQNKIIAEAELPLCALFTTKTLAREQQLRHKLQKLSQRISAAAKVN